jgi:hypothetical protein
MNLATHYVHWWKMAWLMLGFTKVVIIVVVDE